MHLCNRLSCAHVLPTLAAAQLHWCTSPLLSRLALGSRVNQRQPPENFNILCWCLHSHLTLAQSQINYTIIYVHSMQRTKEMPFWNRMKKERKYLLFASEQCTFETMKFPLAQFFNDSFDGSFRFGHSACAGIHMRSVETIPLGNNCRSDEWKRKLMVS